MQCAADNYYYSLAPVSNYVTVAMQNVACTVTDATFAASTVTFEGGSLNVSNSVTIGVTGYGKGTLVLRGGALCQATNIFWIGYAAGATGEIVNVDGQLTQLGGGSTFVIGKEGRGALTICGGTTYIARSPVMGVAASGLGVLNVLEGSNTFGTVVNDCLSAGNSGKGVIMGYGGTNSVRNFSLGDGVGNGVMTLTNGLWSIAESAWVGRSGRGTLLVGGGEMRFLTGGAVLAIGRYAGATGLVTVAAGLLDVNGSLWMGGGANALAQLALTSNGVLRTQTIMEKDAAATSQLVFDGGTLQAAASGTLVQALDDVRLTANGLVVDSAGYNVSIVPTLQDAAGESGSVTKKGAGSLTLAGTRAATGPVSVLGGTLVVSNGVTVTAGTSRIDGTLALTSDNRLTVGAGATLSGTGTVTRLTLVDGAVFARAKADGAAIPLTVADCVAGGKIAVLLSGYDLAELKKSLPLISVPNVFVDPSKVTVTLNGQTNARLRTKYVNVSGRQVLCVFYFEGTLIAVF